MNELERILNVPKEDRTPEDLAYLLDHADELTDDQSEQLEDESADATDDSTDDDDLNDDPATLELKKDIGKEVRKEFPIEIKDKGNSVLEAIVASNAEDRHGEIINIKGLNTKNYMKNPVVAFGHNYDEPPIAKTTSLRKTHDGKLIATMEFATEIYDKAKTIYELYKGGFMKAFSIGFIPEEVDGNTYTKSEMIEFSAVLIPANPEALLLAKKKGLDITILTGYNKSIMNIKELLEKVTKSGIDSLTLAEVKFLNENKDDLTANQIKELSDVLEKTENTSEQIKTLSETVKTLNEELEKLKTNEPIKTKNIAGQEGEPIENVKTFGTTRIAKKFLDKDGEPTKEIKFLHYARGVQSGNFKAYLDIVGKSAMDTSDTSQVVPPAEFLLEIERLEEQVGVAAKFANVRRSTSGNGIVYVHGDDDLEIFDTAESGKKKSTKLTYKQLTLLWRKFAGILPITDELNEDSAVALWNDATQRFARAYAKRADQLVFTEVAAGGNTKNGITKVSGTNVVTPAGGNAVTNIIWENLYDMIYGVPSSSASNGRFFLNRTILGVLAKLKDDQNRPLWQPSVAEGIPATLAGKPYTEVEVMPGVDEDDTATEFVVFGDLRYATLGERTDVQIKIFDTGSVGDPDDSDQDNASDLNLLTQDIQAMRAVKRMNAVVRFPAAFSVLKTAGIS